MSDTIGEHATDVAQDDAATSPSPPLVPLHMPHALARALLVIDSWIDSFTRSTPTVPPASTVPGVQIDVIKGRRDTRKLDSVSLSVIISTICALGMKVLLMVTNGMLITQSVTLIAPNIVLMTIFCLSLLTFFFGLFAASIRSVGLMFVFVWLGLATIVSELVVEAVELAIIPSANDPTNTGLKQQFIFFIFLGQLLQGIMTGAAYRMYSTLKNSRQEETMIRIRRLNVVPSANSTGVLPPVATPSSTRDMLVAQRSVLGVADITLLEPLHARSPAPIPDLSDSSDEESDGELVNLEDIDKISGRIGDKGDDDDDDATDRTPLAGGPSSQAHLTPTTPRESRFAV